MEETYVKKTPIEHILMRPDLYVGPTAAATSTVWTPVKKGRGKKAAVAMKEAEVTTQPHPPRARELLLVGRTLGQLQMNTKAAAGQVLYSPALLKIFDEAAVY